MFQAVLKDVVEATDGGVASVVMDLDGIALESYAKPDAPLDIMTVGIEVSVVLRSARQAATALGAGEATEVAIMTERMTTLVRLITPQYFMALSLGPGGNVGKGRYLLRTRAPELVGELS